MGNRKIIYGVCKSAVVRGGPAQAGPFLSVRGVAQSPADDEMMAFKSCLSRTPAPKLCLMAEVQNQPHSKFRHVYPIVRIDIPFNQASPQNMVTVGKVLTLQEDAELEVARLNKINGDKSCVYFCCTSRLIE
jgi:hypothetical protein